MFVRQPSISLRKTRQQICSYLHDERGTVSLEFIIVFPVFFSFILMSFESGMVSTRHMMLERGVDITVRDVRVGAIKSPTKEQLLNRICEVAQIIPDCQNQLQIEMLLRNPRAWEAIPTEVSCVDRSQVVQPVVEFTTGDNNELVYLIVCVRIDPFFPTTGLGRAITKSSNSAAADGSYALVTRSAFVVEPFAP